MKILSDILHKAGVLKEAAESYTTGGFTVVVRNTATGRLQNISASSVGPVSSVFGRIGDVVAANGDYNTDQVTEGTNLYFTNARARSAVSLTTTNSSGASTYNSTTGVFNIPEYTLSGLGGEPAITAGTATQYWRGDKTWQTLDTSVVTENTNLYFTDSRARLAVSLTTNDSSGAATYNNTTGVFNIPHYTLSGLGGVPSTRQLTINGTAQDLSSDRSWSVGTVTSVAASAGTGISITGSPITESGTITITNTAPDQVVSLTGAGTTSISGSYPSFTITSNDQYVGTVTSVGLDLGTTGTDVGITGSPITTSGTITLNIPTASATNRGALSSGDWTTFNSKEPAITAGTSTQYWRGDKTWQTLDTSVVPENGPVYFTEPRVLATVLAGLNLTGGGSISASDSILQAFGKIQNQISAMVGGVSYQGVWNADTNTPTITASSGSKGHYYVVSVAGTTSIDGKNDWKIGDWIIFDGTVWDKVDNTDAVSSVNGFTGAVSLALGNLSNVTITSPTDAQLLRFNGTNSKWENWTPTYISAAITSLNGLTAATQTFSNDTNVTITSDTATHTIGWSGLLAVSRGGTGVSTANANTVFAGPATGAAAAPTFRSLVAADIPSLAYLPLTGGTITGSLTIDKTDVASNLQLRLKQGARQYWDFITTQDESLALKPQKSTVNENPSFVIQNKDGVSQFSINTSTSNATFSGALSGTSATFSGVGTFNTTANSSWALTVQNSGTTNANGLYVQIGATSTGVPFLVQKGSTDYFKIFNTGAATFSGLLTAQEFIKSGGTASQFLKADGSVDSTSYQPLLDAPIYFRGAVSTPSYTGANYDATTVSGYYRLNGTGDSRGVLVFDPGGSLGTTQIEFSYQGGMRFRNKTDNTTWTSWKGVWTDASLTNLDQLTNGPGYITASSTNTLTNKSGNISQWTNDSGYITSTSTTFTYNASLTLNTTWQDTGVSNSNLTASGTYIVTCNANDFNNGGGQYDVTYTGIMYWFAGSTNSTNTAEIILHRMGHADNDRYVFLRTRTTPSTGGTFLQIKGNGTNTSAATYAFKFKRLI